MQTRSMRIGAVATICAALLTSSGAPRAGSAEIATTAGGSADVTTIAGSGAAGIADGPAHRATFLFPSGIALAKDGSIYVADSAGERIRVVNRDGWVRTVAGSGSVLPPGLIVAPGYHDGPALEAKFNQPAGLAFGPDGGLYIADSYNGCIRKLFRERVTTVLGKCTAVRETAAIDGPADVARLVHPSALAFDPSGTLYIADDGGGLRKFAGGVLTTIHFSEENALGRADVLSAIGLAISANVKPTIVVVTHIYLFAYDPSSGRADIIYPSHLSDGSPFGQPNQIAAIDNRQFVFTDLVSANVRYLRLAELPYNGSVLTRVIAGGRLERGTDNAGFTDGTRADSRFYDPTAIVIAGKQAIVADGGNRRIRRIALPRTSVSEAGLDPAKTTDRRHYEVALVAPSWSFWDSLDGDSICAHIEAAFEASRRFPKPVRCHTIRVDAGKTEVLEEYVKSVFADVHVDLVILDAEGYGYNLPSGEPGQRTNLPIEPGSRTSFAQYLRSRVGKVLQALKPQGTRLALLWVYNAQDTTDAEWVVQGVGFYRSPPALDVHQIKSEIEGVFKGMPVLQYDMYDDIVRYELSPGAKPLYHPIDQHPNPRGNAFFGDHIARGLLNAGLGKP